jgi:hypothetical protein
MHGLKQGNAVLKEIHKELNPESVERLMSETADAVAYQKVRRCAFVALRQVNRADALRA